MKMSKKYWIERFEQEEARNAKMSLQHMQVAKKQYQNTMRKIDSEIRSWYSKYASDNEMSYEEAQKTLSGKDRKNLKLTLEEYIRLGEQQNVSFDTEVEKTLKRVSAGVHVNRLESIKSSIQAELDILYTNVERGLGEHFCEVVGAGYARTNYLVQSMIGNYESISGLNKDLLNQMIYKPWTSDGKNWSNRVWKQKDKLIEELHTSLVQSLVLGDDVNLLADKMSKRLDVGFSRAANLLMTESAAYHSKATELCYKDLGVEKYEILATLDNRTSTVCQGMDGKIFERKQYQVGVTAPLFHCRCRTTTIPYFEDLTEDETRAARDEEGNYVEEKASMKYPEWEEKYLKENEKEGIMNIESFYPLSEKQVNDFQRKSNELFRTLTQDELRAFEMYTGSWYLDVNDYLLKKKNNNNFLDKIIDTIESVMDEFETDENILAYRGIKDWHYRNIQIGDVIETGMFTSTSLSESVAKDFARSTVFEIEIPKGTKGIYIGRNSAYPHEREFLLSHKLKYKVLRREGDTLRLRVIKND
ncbi:Phage head morphogenesis protein [Fusobacterium necrophorum subsp. funduliforme]|uniref:ADP-ribosyltransferase n=1 Tax=Fusobacterium necrophorum TaxID=859 RepID=UPI0007884284|nr:ADP-ribosyltransferase [Fusobacterium necrophorum]AYV92563.1 phage head morphogenesis protein [Fusobacterium necrophorum subsp. funduliforme]KYM43528.1 hypothetical protein A2U05_04330 [Fusobacterium necrophorum subsp. funduliforme]MDK4486759.1 minor capsid protein [Fusobacterium necrophorum]MDK4488629.1 minor capsid protein [Fusobacterium necrophorum]MDK4505130.1 minor capsid protein [Fusobacterium necrophorum]